LLEFVKATSGLSPTLGRKGHPDATAADLDDEIYGDNTDRPNHRPPLSKIGLIVLFIAMILGAIASAKILVAGRMAWRIFSSSPMLLGVFSIV
jgi:hypothetical protein